MTRPRQRRGLLAGNAATSGSLSPRSEQYRVQKGKNDACIFHSNLSLPFPNSGIMHVSFQPEFGIFETNL